MKKYKVLALYGKGGSGKDTIQKWIVSYSPIFNGIISATTRPKRDNEYDGVDYHFYSKENFLSKMENNDFFETAVFNDWYYGTPIDSLVEDKINVGVFNLEGIKRLIEDERVDVLPIEIFTYDKIRLQRMIDREKNPDCHEICRRFLQDDEDFSKVKIENSKLFSNTANRDYFSNIFNLPGVQEWIENGLDRLKILK